MSDDKLFSPFEIKGRTLRNRIGVAPMTRTSSLRDSVPRDDVLEFLVRRARNGAAVVYTEAIVTDYESAQGYPRQARLVTQRQIDAWRPVVSAIQAEGALAIMQMFHCGRMAWNEVNPAGRVIAPSAVAPRDPNPLTGEPYPVPDAMSLFDIEHVIAGFVQTARGAVAAGFDGIEIHGAHGYLISQFLSAYANRRDDHYGGELTQRFRFAHEVIQAVAAHVPDDRLLTFRISNWGVADMDVSLFADADEWRALIGLLDAEPLDAISVSTYDFQQPAWDSGRTMAALTREVTARPLFICGKIHDRASADAALAHADVVLSAKSMLLDPDFVAGLRSGAPLPLHTADEAGVAYTDERLP